MDPRTHPSTALVFTSGPPRPSSEHAMRTPSPPSLDTVASLSQHMTPRDEVHSTRFLVQTKAKAKSKRKTKVKTTIAHNRRGWGPYNSVLKERSVDFNLTLDVQNLRQEIQQLSTVRDLLQSRALQLRHSPTGSLMQLVREYFQLFRTGFRVEQKSATRRRHVITAGVQTDFLYSMVDENIDFGNGLGGIAFMVEMIRRYSLLLRFICMKMDSFSIVLTEDDQGVMVKAKGSLRFQVLRETVAALFPHILGDEWLCAQLIGAEVEAPTMVTFRFNANDRLCGYEPDANYIAAFSQVLRDPNDVLELMGQSKIGEKSMFGVTEEGHVETVSPYDEPEAEREDRPRHIQHQQDHPEDGDARPHGSPVHKRWQPNATASRFSARDYVRVVDRYMLTFANGWPPEEDALAASSALTLPLSPQRSFLDQFVSPDAIVGHDVGHHAIERVWKSLCAGFEFERFCAVSEPQLHDDRGVVSVRVRVAYDLVIDITTLQAVFPHTLRYPEIVQAMLGMKVSCPSDLQFEWHGEDTLVTRLIERLDWDVALIPLLPNVHERAFVLNRAQLSPEGYVVTRRSDP